MIEKGIIAATSKACDCCTEIGLEIGKKHFKESFDKKVLSTPSS